VSLPGSQAGVRKRQPKRAKRPHSKFSDRKALDGPAMRPATPLAVENGVGKLAAERRREGSEIETETNCLQSVVAQYTYAQPRTFCIMSRRVNMYCKVKL